MGEQLLGVQLMVEAAITLGMPGDVRRCPADDQRRIRLGSFSVRKTSQGDENVLRLVTAYDRAARTERNKNLIFLDVLNFNGFLT